MGNEKKLGLADKIKAGIDRTKTEASKATKVGFDAIKDGSEVVAGSAAKAAGVIAANAVKAKDYVDDKARSALDKAYESKRPLAVKNIARIKKSNSSATPAELIDILESDLKTAEDKSGTDSDAFTSAVTLYVFSTVEVYGSKVLNSKKRQLLIDTIVVIDSEVAKVIAQFGGAAVGLLAGRIGALGKAVAAVGKVSNKMAWIKPLTNLAGIKNPGKKSTTWVVTNSTRKILGPAPKSWPKSPAKKASK
jgi:hypothetical protein